MLFRINLTVRHVGRPARATALRAMPHSTTIPRGQQAIENGAAYEKAWPAESRPIHRLRLAETVPDVAVSQNVNWVGSVVLEFFSDLTDENAKVRAFVSEARTA